MDYSSSTPVLYLEDDDDDEDDNNNNKNNNVARNNWNYRQHSSVKTHMSITKITSSTDASNQHKKRKLTNTNVRVNPSVLNSPKRKRNDHYQQQTSQNGTDSDNDPEPILIDPDEYVIEEPDPPQYCSFDWTIHPLPQPVSRLLSPSKPPPPPPPALVPSPSIQTPSRISSINKTIPRPFDKSDNISIRNANNNFVQQQQQQQQRQRKPTAIPVPQPSQIVIPLPLPNPTTSLSRANIQRGRPVNNSRITFASSSSPSLPLPVRRPAEPTIISHPPKPSRSSSSSSLASTETNGSTRNNPTLATRLPILNGTGLFSAYHDSKYYQCNICKFKSVTSSTLLQHLFTHMFFCDQCPYYTYSQYNLSQHLFEKHTCDSNEPINDSLNPKTFDLLYVTRCADGTFALCMESSSNQTNKNSNNDQRLVISSGAPNTATTATPTTSDQYPKKQIVKKNSKQNVSSNEDVNDVAVVLPEKSDSNHHLSKLTPKKDKQNQTYVLMKHRRCYLMKKICRLHSLKLEYDICREHTIRQMCHTQNILTRRKFLIQYHRTRFIDEVASCLRTIVNHIVNNEDNSEQSSPICTLSNNILSSILSTEHLHTITDLLRLNNKHEKRIEQNELYNKEHTLRDSRKHIYVLSSTERNSNEQSIISSLHSSLTNGDSIFTQTKLNKLPTKYDNTYRFLKGSSNSIIKSSDNIILKDQKKSKTTQVASPKPVPLRPVIPKPTCITPKHSSFTTTIDRNNNSVASSNSKVSATKTPTVIVLD